VFRRPLTELISSVPTSPPAAPAQSALMQNYPNPFNGSSDIGFAISEFVRVRLTVYDVLGREVATLVNERRAPGRYQERFDAEALPSGVYLYRLTAGRYVQTRKMVIVR
jgi:hypothetical protein